MPCCMAEEYAWCEDLPVVDYKDEEGKEYCVFHAPQRKKNLSPVKFNEHVFERIKEAKANDTTCDLSGTIFKGYISFSQFTTKNPLPQIDFSGCTFTGNVNFSEVIFSGAADFSMTTFSEAVYFRGTTFGTVDFSESVFNKEILFNRSEFYGTVNFSRVNFNGKTSFSNVKFHVSCDREDEKEVNFSESKFNEEVDFSWTIFDEWANFSRAIFNGESTIAHATFSAGANFCETTFNGRVVFKKHKFIPHKELELHEDKLFYVKKNQRELASGATYNKVKTLMQPMFNGRVNFSRASFNEKAYFFENIFTIGEFIELTVKEKVRLEGTNLKQISFLDTDLRMMDFINCKWPERFWRFGRNVLYDELTLFCNEDKKQDNDNKDKNLLYKLKQRFNEKPSEILKGEWNGLKKDISCNKEKIKKVETLYRRLKQKYKEEHDEFEVSNWHYGEKEMFRKGNRWRRLLPSVSTLYWLSSGYGERPVRAGITLLLLIIIISVLFGLTGIKSITDNSSVIKIKEWADIWNLDFLKATIEYATFESKPTFIPENWFFKIAAKLLIPLQAALFALALRNRFRR